MVMKLLFWTHQRPMRMLWRVAKGGRASHLIGTAHFFPYSFRRSLAGLMRNAKTVMFEGPLDEASSAHIAEYGRQGEEAPTISEGLTPEAITKIDRLLRDRLDGHSDNSWFLSMVERKPIYFESFTQGLRPFAAFFSIWQTCLDWKYSVDMEGYQVACKLGKEIRFLETLDEQLAVLDNISLGRITRLLNDVDNWEVYNRNYVEYYLEGELEALVRLTSRFATRGPVVVSARDRILFERMLPVIEQKDALAFIGFPHIPGVMELFREEGYTVTQASP